MHTREDYLNKNCTHHEYYKQFITPEIMARVKSRFGEAIIKSQDQHFNDIPLNLWNDLAKFTGFKSMKDYGDYLTEAGSVCILKACATEIRMKESSPMRYRLRVFYWDKPTQEIEMEGKLDALLESIKGDPVGRYEIKGIEVLSASPLESNRDDVKELHGDCSPP